MKEYQEAGLLSSMESYSKQYGWEELLLPWSYSAGVFDGEFYSAPKTFETMIMLYNKTLFEEKGWSLPTNLNEYESLAKTIQDAGMHEVAFNASSVPSGMYLYTLKTETKTIINKMMVMK